MAGEESFFSDSRSFDLRSPVRRSIFLFFPSFRLNFFSAAPPGSWLFFFLGEDCG